MKLQDPNALSERMRVYVRQQLLHGMLRAQVRQQQLHGDTEALDMIVDAADMLDLLGRLQEVVRHERDDARARLDMAVKVLKEIHFLLYPPTVTTPTGVRMRFLDPDVHNHMQMLSDRIREIPDHIRLLETPLKVAPKPGDPFEPYHPGSPAAAPDRPDDVHGQR